MGYNDRLFALLRTLESSELDDVWHLLGRRPDADDFDKRAPEAKIEPISKRLRAVASHDLLRIVRGAHDHGWKDILVQIAEKLKIENPRSLTEQQLEVALWKLLDSDDPRSHERLANTAAWKAYLGSMLIPIPLGPLARLTMGPSYRKLVPAVLYIIDRNQLRDRLEQQKGSV